VHPIQIFAHVFVRAFVRAFIIRLPRRCSRRFQESNIDAYKTLLTWFGNLNLTLSAINSEPLTIAAHNSEHNPPLR